MSDFDRIFNLRPRSTFLFLSYIITFGIGNASAEDLSTDATKLDRIQGAYFGSVVADALCLGSHYEYDAKVIKAAYNNRDIETFMAPGEKMGGSTHGVGWGRRNYHPGQEKGDNTDYGVYNELMLEYFSKYHSEQSDAGGKKNTPILFKKLIPLWKKKLENDWGAWKCTMTKTSLQTVQQRGIDAIKDFTKIGGMSNAMGLRCGACFGVYDNEDYAATAARESMFTHQNEDALVGGEFFTRLAFKIIYDDARKPDLKKLIEQTSIDMAKKLPKQSGDFVKEQVKKGIAKFEEVSDNSKPLGKEEFVDDLAMTSMARLWEVGKSEPIKVGKASPTEGTMPSSIYMVLKYENDFAQAVRANAMVGGDNASRSVAIGMVLGALHGAAAIPDMWKKDLNAWKRSEQMLKKLPIVKELMGKVEERRAEL